MTVFVGETSPEQIATFMQQVIVQYQAFADDYRRSEPREPVAVPVNVVPLDDDLRAIDPAFDAVTRDVSCGGLGIFHSEPIGSPYVQIAVESPETHEVMRLLARVEHCTPCGAFYIVGCRFTDSDQSDIDA
jgi:hypothetical protein